MAFNDWIKGTRPTKLHGYHSVHLSIFSFCCVLMINQYYYFPYYI